jgi:hypothetical protein
VLGTGGLTLANSSGFQQIPGLTATVNVPAGADVLVSYDGGTSASTGTPLVEYALDINGDLLLTGQFSVRHYVAGSGQLTYWSRTGVLSLPPGQSTISVMASNLTNGATAEVSAAPNYPKRGSLTVVILKN